MVRLKWITNFKSNFEKKGGKDIIIEINESGIDKSKYQDVKNQLMFGIVKRIPNKKLFWQLLNQEIGELQKKFLKYNEDEYLIVYSD